MVCPFEPTRLPVPQPGRLSKAIEHALTGIATISANASKGWRSSTTGGSLPPRPVLRVGLLRVEPVVSNPRVQAICDPYGFEC
jgi:hypothetical protein